MSLVAAAVFKFCFSNCSLNVHCVNTGPGHGNQVLPLSFKKPHEWTFLEEFKAVSGRCVSLCSLLTGRHCLLKLRQWHSCPQDAVHPCPQGACCPPLPCCLPRPTLVSSPSFPNLATLPLCSYCLVFLVEISLLQQKGYSSSFHLSPPAGLSSLVVTARSKHSPLPTIGIVPKGTPGMCGIVWQCLQELIHCSKLFLLQREMYCQRWYFTWGTWIRL